MICRQRLLRWVLLHKHSTQGFITVNFLLLLFSKGGIFERISCVACDFSVFTGAVHANTQHSATLSSERTPFGINELRGFSGLDQCFKGLARGLTISQLCVQGRR